MLKSKRTIKFINWIEWTNTLFLGVAPSILYQSFDMFQLQKGALIYGIYSNARWGFCLTLVAEIFEVILICMWRSKLDPATPDCSELDHVETNQGLHHQIAMCRWKIEQSLTKINLNSPLAPFFLLCPLSISWKKPNTSESVSFSY
jgi:hypothetical protein